MLNKQEENVNVTLVEFFVPIHLTIKGAQPRVVIPHMMKRACRPWHKPNLQRPTAHLAAHVATVSVCGPFTGLSAFYLTNKTSSQYSAYGYLNKGE